MENLFDIRLNYKKTYSFGAFHSGFSLFDSLTIVNQSDLAFSALKLQLISSPNIILSAEQNLDYIAPGSARGISCDFINLDASLLAATKKVLDVCVTVLIYDQENSLLATRDFSCKILPYFYFCGTGDMAETAAFFVTPQQEELDRIHVEGKFSDALDFSQQLYDSIKDLRITFSPEDYSGSVPLPVKLSERVIKEHSGNSFELSLLFASALERAGFSAVIAFSGKGKVYGGFSLREEKLPLVTLFSKGERNLEGLYLIDGSVLAFGSSLPFDTALFQSKNALQLSDDKLLVISVDAARAHGLSPLPPRVSEKGNYVLSTREEDDHHHRFSDFDQLWKDYSDDDRVKSILLGSSLSANSKKQNFPFQPDLDVNQNKILGKVLSSDVTLIRAQTGSGVSTLFAKACAQKLKSGKNVLYITDADYHPEDFSAIASKAFDQSFVWNLLKDGDPTFRKEDLQSTFPVDETVFEDKENWKNALEGLDSYYSALEGGRSIVSSFLMASDRYDQLRDANDMIIFSPEQVGMLSDDMVQNWFSTVNDIVKTVSEIGSIHQNPLMLVKNKNFSYEYKSRFIRNLEDLLRCLEEMIETRDQILPSYSSLTSLHSYPLVKAFCDLISLFRDFKKLPESFFEDPGSVEKNFRLATRLIQAKEENDNIHHVICVSFLESVFDLDAEDLHLRYTALGSDKSFKAMSQKHSILKSVKRFLKPNCDVENIEYILSRLYTYRKNRELIDSTAPSVFSIFSVLNMDKSGWKELSDCADLCYQCFTVFQSYFDLEKLPGFVSDFAKSQMNSAISEKVLVLKDLCEEFTVLKKELERTVFNELDFFYPANPAEDYFVLLRERIDQLLSTADHLKNWCGWLTVKEHASSCGLKSVILAIENGKIDSSEIKRSFLRAFFKAVCEYNFIAHPELIPENFSIEEAVYQFRSAYGAYSAKEKCQLNSVLSPARFDALREIEKASFSPSELLDHPRVFSSVFPCVVSDLKQAKKLFSGRRHLFDTILVESRNSVPLEDLIWMFHSCRQFAFAGSFSYAIGKGDVLFDLSAPAFDYLWKIVDEKYSLSASYYSTPELTNLKNLFFTQARSDLRYYTVPCARFNKSAELRHLPGAYGGEYPDANYFEAQNAVEELVSFAMAENKKSIGIIAATSAQKKLILRLFAQKLRHQEDLKHYFTDYNRFYISAVGESIYPCDYVVFSLTYSADRSAPGSRLPASFHDFGGGDPVKAIGAVLSTAKEKLLVLTSFRENDLDASPSLLHANTAFRYLFSALQMPQSNGTYRVIGALEEVEVVKRLRLELQERGYQTVSGIQSGRYFIDLGILNENGDFALGVISDHSVLNQKANIASIELANAAYFEKNGWQLYRLRSASCFDSFDNELQRVLQLLQGECFATSEF